MLDNLLGTGTAGASRDATPVDTKEGVATSATDADNLAETLPSELESVVRAVQGVDTLYPAKPVLAKIVDTVVDALTHRDRTTNLVSVTVGDAGIKVGVALRVVNSEPATEVCRLVFDSIARVLDDRSIAPVDSIQVTVASIG